MISRSQTFLAAAVDQAAACLADDTPAAGAVLARGDRQIATGRTRYAETGDPIRYAAMDCISNAGRRTDQAELTLYLSSEPNWLDAGTIVQFGIGEVVINAEHSDAEPVRFMIEHDVNILFGKAHD